MADLNINLLRDTQDPEAEAKEPDRFHPPKLSDFREKPKRGPKATAKSPKPSFLQLVRDFFGIKPRVKAPPRILSTKPAPEPPKPSSAPVPFRPAASVGAPAERVPPSASGFTVRPRPPEPPPPPRTPVEAPLRGEPLLEELFAEPPAVTAPIRPKAPTPEIPLPTAENVRPGRSPFEAPPPRRRPEPLLEEILKEPPEGSSVFPPPPPPRKPPLPAPLPPEEPPRETTFRELPIAGVSARPVKQRTLSAIAKPEPKPASRIGMRVKNILERFIPRRVEPLPEGESPEDIDVNLVPEELSAKLNLGDKAITLALTALMVGLLVGLAYTGLKVYESNIIVEKQEIVTQINTIKGELLSLQSEQLDAIAFYNRAEAVRFALAKHVHWTKFFQLLEKYTEKDVYFVNFAGDLSGNLTLAAFGTSYDSVARQYTTFQNARDFITSVTISSAQSDAEGEQVAFSATLQLIPSFYLQLPD